MSMWAVWVMVSCSVVMMGMSSLFCVDWLPGRAAFKALSDCSAEKAIFLIKNKINIDA